MTRLGNDRNALGFSENKLIPSLMQGQIIYLFKNKALGVWSNIVLASILFLFLSTHLPEKYLFLLLWLGLIISLSIARYVIGFNFKYHHQYSQTELASWANKHVFFTVLLSTIWGSAGVLFFPNEYPHLILLIMLLFSVLLVAIPTLAASRLAYVFQVLVTLVPITIMLILTRQPGYDLLSIATIILGITLLLASSFIYHLLFDLQKNSITLQQLADTDQLTGLANRRHFERKFKDEWRRAMRAKTPISLLIIDIDFFKLYNDVNGHKRGDECLREISRALASITNRPADFAARYGGEEFVVLLPATKQVDATMLAERLRRKIEALNIDFPESDYGIMTVSVGVSCCEPTWDTATSDKESESEQKVVFPAMLLTAADNALYVAKHQGKNRISEQGCGDHKLSSILHDQILKDENQDKNKNNMEDELKSI